MFNNFRYIKNTFLKITYEWDLLMEEMFGMGSNTNNKNKK